MEHEIPINFAIAKDTRKIIKVIGVGGGGGNAVQHMYREGIHDVSFVLCNTDEQAMNKSDVPVKICLGRNTSKGLGAGNKPEKGLEAAKESEEEIRNMLNDGTQMVFITATMGGGTGTGAAPFIAKIAKDMDILTVSIVTIPFLFEGQPKIVQALKGVEELSKNVDALIVINNERLFGDIYEEDDDDVAFGKVNDILNLSAKSISEIITIPGIINLDFADVKTTMKDSGVALISNGFGEGEGRLEQAIAEAFKSPLLNNGDVTKASRILFNIATSSKAKTKIKEMKYFDEFKKGFGENMEVIWGTSRDESLENKIKFTVLATGYGFDYDKIETVNNEADTGAAAALIAKYYQELIDGKNKYSVSKSSYVLLTFDEMCNDAIVSMVENNPTYNRESSLLNKIALEKQRQPDEKAGAENVRPAVISGF